MRKIFIISSLLILTRLAWSITYCTFILNLQDAGVSSNFQNITVRFDLKNSGTIPPKVPGTFFIVPSFKEFHPDNTGLVTGQLVGNDILQPSTTYYTMTLNQGGTAFYKCDLLVTGTSLNLNSVSCLNSSALPPPPPVCTPTCLPVNYLVNGVLFGSEDSMNLVAGPGISITASDVPAVQVNYTINNTVGQTVYNGLSQSGVDPTGVNDSTVGIQNGCTAAGVGNIYYLPLGTYKISSTVVCPAYTNIVMTGNASGASGPNGTVLEWNGSNGTVLSEVGSGPCTSDLTCRGTRIEGFSIKNIGGATIVDGIHIQDMQGVHFDHINMILPGGYCEKLISTIQVERTSFGPDIHEECGDGVSTGGSGDVGFITTGGGSFENTFFDGPKLDGHAIDIGAGSVVYGSDLTWFGNAVTSTLMTISGQLVNSNLFINVDGNNSSTCHTFYVGASGIVALKAFFSPRGCIGTTTVVSGGHFGIVQAGYSTDAGSMAMWNSGGSYDVTSGTYTTYIGSADRMDLGNDTDAFGLYSNPTSGYSGAWLWTQSALHQNVNCLALKDGAATISSSATEASICMDGTVKVGQSQGLTYSIITAPPYNTIPNGSIVYCSDCNTTCTAGSSTGRTCFRENGVWTH